MTRPTVRALWIAASLNFSYEQDDLSKIGADCLLGA